MTYYPLRLIPAMVAVCLGLLLPGLAMAQPANDLFVNAWLLTGTSVTTNGSTSQPSNATRESGEPRIVNNNFGGRSVWFIWTAPANGPTQIDTSGSGFNTLLGVYTGTAVNALTLVAQNDNGSGLGNASLVSFTAQQGVTYRIAIDGRSNGGGGGGSVSSGSYNLHLTLTPTASIAISFPGNGSNFLYGNGMTFLFTTNFPAPPLTRIELRSSYGLNLTNTEDPFEITIPAPPLGTHTFYATAYDTGGNVATSPSIRINIATPGVIITSPVDGTIFPNTNPIPINVVGFYTGGNLLNVDFYADGIRVGQSTTSPFSAIWNSVNGGSHRLTVIGSDDDGNTYTSAPVFIAVNQLLIHSNAVWKYLDNGTDQGTNWIGTGFDDGSWLSGPAELGYGDNDEATVVEDNPTPGYNENDSNRYITTYFRRTFSANGVAALTNMSLLLAYDDAAAVYLNGHEIYRTANLPAGASYTTVATGSALEETVVTVTLGATNLVEGTNIIAAEVHQQAASSSDISFYLQLIGFPAIVRNESPLVAITNILDNQNFLAPLVVTIEASASDADGTVAKVEFFADGIKLGEDASSPYSFDWNLPALGAHTLQAVATDDKGATRQSVPIPVVVFDAEGLPLVQITAPANGVAALGPTNMVISASALAVDAVTNIQFLANGVPFGEDATSPYTAIWNAPFGSNGLSAIAFGADGKRGTSAVVTAFIIIPETNIIAPTVLTQNPVAGSSVVVLTNVTINFSERVQNVDASDLLVNGSPAVGVTGTGSNYTFRFPAQPVGEVDVRFAPGHGIIDFGFPSTLPFDETAPSASWKYTVRDSTAPVIAAHVPASGATVSNLSEVSVTFSEEVLGVNASDLLLNNVPALDVTGSGSNYVFTVGQPASGNVNVTWVSGNGITDVASNAFNRNANGNFWSFAVNARTYFFQTNTVWKYFKGLSEASTPATAWREPGFDDSGWSASVTPFLYGESSFTNAQNPGTGLPDMVDNAYLSLYLRKEFVFTTPSAVTNLVLNHLCDDGFIMWLNGIEIYRYNMSTGEVAFNGSASDTAPESGRNGNNGVSYISVTLPNAPAALVSGTNLVAIHAFNYFSTPASSDFVINAAIYTTLTGPGVVPPRLAQVTPVQGDVFALTNIAISFTEPVTGVDASDLLVNGVPAASVNSTTNTTYDFSFAQPAYGPVTITWAPGHLIADLDSPPKDFDGSATNAMLHYSLVNPSAPGVAGRAPAAGATITSLPSVDVTFSEGVNGVEATDLLVNGVPATSVTSSTASNYTFGFPAPALGSVTIRWATNHGIQDLEVPANAFDPARPGNTWNYTLVSPAPAVAIVSPTNGATISLPANITITATAVDYDGTVAKVEFFSSNTKLGERTNSPYTLAWTNVNLGSYTLRAVATDNTSLSSTSSPVSVTVVSGPPAVLQRGPYLLAGSPTGGVVRWRTDKNSDAVVYYGTDPSGLTNVAMQATASTNHLVRISGLQPSTKYYYSIGSSSETVATGSNYWFRTSPPHGTRNQPTRIWVLGDAGTATYGTSQAASQRSVRDAFYTYAASTRGADLWLMLGDNAYSSGTDAEHQTAVFNMYPDTLRNLFLWPVLGNHESSQSYTANSFPYLDIFSTPQNAEAGGVPSGNPKYYSFDYGNIHFVGLDSMTSTRSASSAMALWLQSDLAATAQEWIIVYFHHPPYTKGSHNSDSETDLIEMRQNIVPILEANGVDLVLNGHSHCFERSYLINGHYGLSTTLTSGMKVDGGDGRTDGTGAYRKNSLGQGTVYNVCGSSGQISGGNLNHPAHFVSLNELGSLVIDVSSNRLDAVFLTSSGATHDHYTLMKAIQMPPATPLNLVAATGTNRSINLVWQDVATNELGYLIEQSLDGTNFNPLLTEPANSTNAHVGGLLPGVTYFYRVRATSAAGASEYSNIASAGTSTENAAPIAVADTLYRLPDQNLFVDITTLLANDSDPDGDPLVLDGYTATSVNGGTVQIQGSQLVYAPPAGFNGADSFTYTISDPQASHASAEVSIRMSVNSAPLFTPIGEVVGRVLNQIEIPLTAFDADIPSNVLKYALAPGAPGNVLLNPDTGLLFWMPTREQGRSTNLLTVSVTDNGLPPLSATQTLSIIVRDYVEVTMDSIAMNAGQTGSVALVINPTTGLIGLQVELHYPQNLLTGLVMTAVSPDVTSFTQEALAVDSVLLTFDADPSQPMRGAQTVARLNFTAVAGQTSAFLPLEVYQVLVTRADPGLAPRTLLNNGRVAVLGTQSLVEGKSSASTGRELLLYSRPGGTYTIEVCPNVNVGGPWATFLQLTPTNIIQVVPLPNSATNMFFRIKE